MYPCSGDALLSDSVSDPVLQAVWLDKETELPAPEKLLSSCHSACHMGQRYHGGPRRGKEGFYTDHAEGRAQ